MSEGGGQRAEFRRTLNIQHSTLNVQVGGWVPVWHWTLDIGHWKLAPRSSALGVKALAGFRQCSEVLAGGEMRGDFLGQVFQARHHFGGADGVRMA